MKNELTIISKSLPEGSLKLIADKVGCSYGTVYNVFHSKHSGKQSRYQKDIIDAAIQIVKENIATKNELEKTAQNLLKESI
ncbi:hypothetical protein EZS27_004063 [termite gut metagenome]|uniref:HTH psq-type domain-containing protein n=1 Tax=termite gut metagenome TaxID=433724 RepID=A0A5J4STB5_9ZZZZ